MEESCTTLYLLAIATFALSVTICEIFALEICMTLTLEWASVKYKYTNEKAVYDFVYQCLPYLSPVLTVKMILELTKVKCKYSKRQRFSYLSPFSR